MITKQTYKEKNVQIQGEAIQGHSGKLLNCLHIIMENTN